MQIHTEIPNYAGHSDPSQRLLRPSPAHGAQTQEMAHHRSLPTPRGGPCPHAFERSQQRCSTKSRRSRPSHNVEQMAHSKTLSARGHLLSQLLPTSPRLHRALCMLPHHQVRGFLFASPGTSTTTSRHYQLLAHYPTAEPRSNDHNGTSLSANGTLGHCSVQLHERGPTQTTSYLAGGRRHAGSVTTRGSSQSPGGQSGTSERVESTG